MQYLTWLTWAVICSVVMNSTVMISAVMIITMISAVSSAVMISTVIIAVMISAVISQLIQLCPTVKPSG